MPEVIYDVKLDDEGLPIWDPDNNEYLLDYDNPIIANRPVGTAHWYPDADGNYTEATDPRNIPGSMGRSYDDLNALKGEVPISSFKYKLTEVEADTTPKGKVKLSRTLYHENLQRRDAGFAPSLNGSYEIFDGWKLHAAYTHGIRMPSITESSSSGASVSGPLTLRPEQARNLEIGISTKMENVAEGGDTLVARLSYFNNKTKDYVTRHQPFHPDAYDDPVQSELASQNSFAFYNADSFTVKGLELQTAYDNGAFFADMSASYNFSAKTCAPAVAEFMMMMSKGSLKDVPGCVDGGFSGSFANAQNPPRYTFSGTFGARFLDEALEIATRVTHTGGPTKKLDQTWHLFGGGATQLVYQPVTLFDVSASYKISENATAGFSIENVFDRYYLDPLSLSMMPGPGRTFKASLTMKF